MSIASRRVLFDGDIVEHSDQPDGHDHAKGQADGTAPSTTGGAVNDSLKETENDTVISNTHSTLSNVSINISGSMNVKYSTSKKLSSSGSVGEDRVTKDGQNASDRSSMSSDYQECIGGGDVSPHQRLDVPPADTPSSVRIRGSVAHSRTSSTEGNGSMASGKSKTSSDKKKSKGSWYNVLSPSYKSKSDDFKRLFKDIPKDERLLVDYSCAVQKDILVQGRLYISQTHVCFYANIFRWETILVVNYMDIVSVTKEKTARVIPNAIQVCTKDDKYFFTSFGTRDKSYVMLFRAWQNALLGQSMTSQELWQWVHYNYGDELGLTSDDDDYISPSHEDEVQFRQCLQPEETSTTDNHKEPQDECFDPPPSAPNPPSTDTISLAASGAAAVSTDDVVSTGDRPEAAIPGQQAIRPTSLGSTLQVPGGFGGKTSGAAGDVATDDGDTTEDDEEVLCTGHEHKSIDSLNEVFFLDIDHMFELIFTDSGLFREFMNDRKTSGLELNPWSDADDHGNRTRTLYYTLAVSYLFGDTISMSQENQVCYSDSRPGSSYLVDVEFISNGIPYSDNFTVTNRYCLTRVGRHKTRLRVSSQINYKKKVWGPIKSIIDKNATTGIIQNFTMLAEHLRRMSDTQMSLHASSQAYGRKRVVRRKRGPGERQPTVKRSASITNDVYKPAPMLPGGKEVTKEEYAQKTNVDVLTKIVCFLLLCLVLFNAVLFCKLRSLEEIASRDPFSRDNIITHDNLASPKSSDEWMHLLERQQQLHTTEIRRWEHILRSTVQLMDHMKLTLQALQESIGEHAKFVADEGHSSTT